MTYIMGKNRNDIIKTLKKLGEIVIVAKAEIIYAFKPNFFPHQTTEEVMEEIKKEPEAYEYYRAGLIKITDIKEVGEKELSEGSCTDAGFESPSSEGVNTLRGDSKPTIVIGTGSINDQHEFDGEEKRGKTKKKKE